MKQLTTAILLLIMVLGCNAQEPHLAYSVEYVDSLKTGYEQRIENLKYIIDSDIFSTNLDTCKLIANDGIIHAEIIKEGQNIWINIIDGNKRINSDYIDSESKVLIMNDTITIGSMFINATNTKGTSYIEL